MVIQQVAALDYCSRRSLCCPSLIAQYLLTAQKGATMAALAGRPGLSDPDGCCSLCSWVGVVVTLWPVLMFAAAADDLICRLPLGYCSRALGHLYMQMKLVSVCQSERSENDVEKVKGTELHCVPDNRRPIYSPDFGSSIEAIAIFLPQFLSSKALSASAQSNVHRVWSHWTWQVLPNCTKMSPATGHR